MQTSFLGDVVLTTALLRELAASGPVDVVVRAEAAGVLAGNPGVRRVIVYDKRGRDGGIGGLWRVGRRLRAGGPYGAAYLAQGSPRSAMLAVVAGCRERVGFDTSRNARAFYTRVVRYRADRHHAERLWALASPDGAPTAEQVRPALYPGADERAAVDAVLAPLTGRRFVALAPGSVWATKRWPFYAELAGALAGDVAIVLVGGPGDAGLAGEIVAACPPGTAVDAAGRLSLLASAALIGRAALLVTNDSAPQHLASAVGTPTLAIFGPTVPAFGFGPLAPGSVTVGVDDLACRPCDRHGPRVCPLGHWRCMREQAPGAVAARARAMLADLSLPDSRSTCLTPPDR
ncbi:ADP-heptosyltransferase [Gemmatimonadetes bacterium T265]|nr:ADP-heptosyltransferase [Gemmatimonadetes bacterium T265]